MNASEIRFCPRCGSSTHLQERFDKLRPVCPVCDWVFFADPKVAVAVLVRRQNTVLLVRRMNAPQRGLWTMPGGYMDAGEDPRRAAERECAEETGLQVQVADLIDFDSRPADSLGANLILYFQGKYMNGDLQPADDAERAEFFPIDKLPPLAFESPEWIRQIFNNR
jgi:ADP-ribose pyrophosphatase YjhB (NUDIX family)